MIASMLNPRFWLNMVLLVILGILGYVLTIILGRQNIMVSPQNILASSGNTDHGYFIHGIEGDQADNCFHQHGPSRIYKVQELDKRFTWHFICQDDSGKYYDYIMDALGNKLTGFSPKNGAIEEIVKWLARKQAYKWVTVDNLPGGIISALKTMEIPNLPPLP
jgi:hypothetical protein